MLDWIWSILLLLWILWLWWSSTDDHFHWLQPLHIRYNFYKLIGLFTKCSIHPIHIHNNIIYNHIQIHNAVAVPTIANTVPITILILHNNQWSYTSRTSDQKLNCLSNENTYRFFWNHLIPINTQCLWPWYIWSSNVKNHWMVKDSFYSICKIQKETNIAN